MRRLLLSAATIVAVTISPSVVAQTFDISDAGALTATTTQSGAAAQVHPTGGALLDKVTVKPAARAPGVGAPPAAVDLSGWDVPVGDQGGVGSCVTWAINYSMMGWYSRLQGISPGGIAYAPMYAYSQIHVDNSFDGGGTYPSSAYGIASSQGNDTQSDYFQGNYDFLDLPTAAETANAAHWKTGPFSYLYSGTPGVGAVSAIETAIANHQPVAITIPVYSAFDNLNPSSFHLDASQIDPSTYRGSHEVLIVGYDSTGVRIENSWNTGWGDSGYANLNWNFVENYSLEATTMTGLVAAPMAPATVNAIAGTGGTATVTWTAPVNAGGSAVSSYAVTRDGVDTSGTGPYSTTVSGSTASVTLTKLKPGTTYHVTVAATNATGTGPAAATTVILSGQAPSPVAGLTASQTGTGAVTVSWQPPTSNGGQPITGYTVARDGSDTSGSGAYSTTVSASTSSTTLTKLINGDTYHFTVTALNASGPSTPVTTTVTIHNSAGPAAGSFVKISPLRIFDTRAGTGVAKAAVPAHATITVAVAGAEGVPSGASVMLTVMVTSATSAGGIIVYPAGKAAPATTNIAFSTGQTTANSVVARLGTGGKLTLLNNSSGTVQLVGDLNGYYLGGTPTLAGMYGSITPAHLVDSTTGLGVSQAAVKAHSSITVTLAGRGGVPTVTAGTAIVLVDLGASTPTAAGSLTAYEAGTTRPSLTTVAFETGRPSVNMAAVRVSSSGQITIYNNSTGTVQIKLDALGWYRRGKPTVAGAFAKVSPARLVDTRTGVGAPLGAVPAHGLITVQVTGRLTVPANGVTAVLINLNAFTPIASGYLTAWPTGAVRPPAQQSNFTAGHTSASYVIARVSSSGQISIYNGSSSTVQISADIVAYDPSFAA
jgi:Fibronectin type III domain/Papain family cysteine protease